jgi:hypothetical protein
MDPAPSWNPATLAAIPPPFLSNGALGINSALFYLLQVCTSAKNCLKYAGFGFGALKIGRRRISTKSRTITSSAAIPFGHQSLPQIDRRFSTMIRIHQLSVRTMAQMLREMWPVSIGSVPPACEKRSECQESAQTCPRLSYSEGIQSPTSSTFKIHIGCDEV